MVAQEVLHTSAAIDDLFNPAIDSALLLGAGRDVWALGSKR
jgi:hypothetical protein